ncbi:MAG TPA: PD-(D/E)XK nuclease family protein [Bacillota bacterium]
MERALLDRLATAATTRAQVVSFRRLEQRVFQEAGGAVRPVPSELAKRLVLRLALARSEADLKVFAGSARRPGFVDRLSRTIRELRDQGVEAAALAEAARHLEDSDPRLAARLGDLAALLTRYEALLQDRFDDPDRGLARAAARLAAARSLRGAAVWVDGFAGFTPAEYRFLEALLLVCGEMTVALCIDGRRRLGEPPAEADLFRQTHDTYHRLLRLAERVGAAVTAVDVLDDDAPPPRFAAVPSLAWVEAWLFRAGRPREAAPDPGDAIEVVAAVDPRREVEAVARRIRRLCRDQGLRPREIAVVVRSLEPYEAWIRRVFADYGIPYFIDRRGSLSHHPLLELVRSALEVVAADWPAEAVFRYLKTDLAGIERETVDRLERYVVTHGIRGRWWYGEAPWRFRRLYSLEAEPEDLDPASAADLDLLDQERRRAAAPLIRLQERLAPARRDAQPARGLVEAVVQLLIDLDAGTTLERWVAGAEAAGDLVVAREHRQAWDLVAGVLEVCAQVLGDEPMTLAEFRQVLEGALEGLQPALIPPALDQVLVGSVERSRQPDVRAVFVMGANDGLFPAVPDEDPIFGDSDRAALAELGVELAAGSRLRLFHERYLAYIALTRSRERLCVSYALTDGAGRQQRPSPIVARLHRLFPGLVEQVEPAWAADPAEPPRLDRFEIPGRLAGALLPVLRAARRGPAPHPRWWGAWSWLTGHAVHGGMLRRLARALAEPLPVADLPPDLVEGLYGSPLRTSVSRLERFAACPFQHFALHGLRLEEPPSAEIDPARLGSLMHAVLSRLAGGVRSGGRSLADLGDAERRSLVERAVDAVAPRLAEEVVLDSARQAFLVQRVRDIIGWVVEVLVEQERRGRFVTVATELPFGHGGEDALPPLRLDLPGGRRVLVRGRIDRVDLAEVDGETWVRVVDYKSSRRSLSLDEVYHGLALQLVAYLAVVVDAAPAWLGRTAHPGGAYYQPLIEPVVDEPVEVGDGGDAEGARDAGRDAGDAARAERLKASKLAGLTAADPRVIRAMDAAVGSGVSELVDAGLTRDGVPRKSERVAPEQQIVRLLDFARQRMAALAGGILAGRIAPRPYRKPNGEVPCGYCPFQAFCRFEGAYGHHRDLTPVDGRTFWREVTGS